MNHVDELRQIPPPLGCQICDHRISTTGPDGKTRHECQRAYPMHPNCGWRIQVRRGTAS